MKNHGITGATLCLAATLFSGPARATTPQETKPFDYASYAAVLTKHVDEKGRVDYVGLRKEPEQLDAFLASLAKLEPEVVAKWKPNDRIAFWINAYNAFTLKAIVEHRPEKSIREIEGVWKKLEWPVLGEKRTLDEIENQILRKQYDEPRIHLGLVCASVGCPTLRAEPFEGRRLAAQLDEQAKQFFADPTKFRIDRKQGEVHVSPLFDWFGKDFVKRHGDRAGSGKLSPEWRAVIRFAGGYLGESERDFLRSGGFRIVLLEYDWSLNRRPRKGVGRP